MSFEDQDQQLVTCAATARAINVVGRESSIKLICRFWDIN